MALSTCEQARERKQVLRESRKMLQAHDECDLLKRTSIIDGKKLENRR